MTTNPSEDGKKTAQKQRELARELRQSEKRSDAVCLVPRALQMLLVVATEESFPRLIDYATCAQCRSPAFSLTAFQQEEDSEYFRCTTSKLLVSSQDEIISAAVKTPN